ncbi:hypothetical protein V1279_003340 [Bradyrhizobium sp. AZCC 1610]
MRKRISATLATAVTFVLIGATLSPASVLPNGWMLPQLADGLNNPRHFQNGQDLFDDVLTLDNGVGKGTVVTTVSTQPSFRADVSVNGQGLMAAYAFGGYYFQYNGPNPEIHVLITGSGGVSNAISTPNQVSAYFQGGSYGTVLLGEACGSTHGGCGTQQSSTSFSTPFTLTNGTIYNIQMNLFVDANTLGIGGGTDTQFAFIDPIISFDPAFGNQGPLDLLFTGGVGNIAVGGVPEPSTWAMMILGFAGVGYMTYRRRKTVALAA